MDIYLTNLEGSSRIRFPVLPQSISVQNGSLFQDYNIMAKGEVKVPYGKSLTGFSWQGIFPGATRKTAPYIRWWFAPEELIRQLEFYQTRGNKLQLMVTETSIAHDVYIQSFDGEYTGGVGDFNYSISFVNAKSLTVRESTTSPAPSLANTPPADYVRPEPPPPRTHTVVRGDTLWGIAQRYLGAGHRYPEIHAANRDVIGANPNRIFPGQVFTIPS